MAVTLAQAKLNVQDALQLGVIDEFRKSSFLFDNLTFDDCVSPTGGGSTLTYAYTRLVTQPTAAFRAVNSEYTASEVTKQRYIKEIQGLRRYDPPYTNWVLFVGMEEAFLMYVGASYDAYRIKMAVSKAEEWYIGDGLYSDGPSFAFDYYNAFVIQPMYTEILEMVAAKKPNDTYLVRSHGDKDNKRNGAKNRVNEVRKRMQKYAVILERFISPEGTFPVVGRSIPYRMAVFQPLAQLAWRKQLPKELSNGQVRAGITAVAKNMFEKANNFNKQGFLTIGFVGNHPNVADWYTNNGSLYMTSLAFLPLGLPADDPFWTDPAEKWTSKKAWDGDDFPKDHKWDINRQIL